MYCHLQSCYAVKKTVQYSSLSPSGDHKEKPLSRHSLECTAQHSKRIYLDRDKKKKSFNSPISGETDEKCKIEKSKITFLTIELTYHLPYVLRQVLILLNLQLPSSRLLYTANERKLLPCFSYWVCSGSSGFFFFFFKELLGISLSPPLLFSLFIFLLNKHNALSKNFHKCRRGRGENPN